ncbi:Aspartic proteinase nepenthesin-1 [Hordeum vulgare]|nr:Aspartic proteinase nepenthesin-1 [Hordeum vulgare]
MRRKDPGVTGRRGEHARSGGNHGGQGGARPSEWTRSAAAGLAGGGRRRDGVAGLVGEGGCGARGTQIRPAAASGDRLGFVGQPSDSCDAETPTGRTTVPLSHRHRPCASAPSKEHSLSERLRHDVARAAYVHEATDGYDYGLHRSDSVETLLGDALGSMEYAVSVGIGSPALGQTMIMDTGSQVSSVRCNIQVSTPFDPMASSSCAPFSCNAVSCSQFYNMWNGCSQEQCQCTVSYNDDSYTAGQRRN